MTWIDAAAVSEIVSGVPKIVEIAGKQVGLFHEGGRHYAVLNFCPHYGAPICRGKVFGAVTADGVGQLGYDHDRCVLRCPWHHWEFDLHTGKSLLPIREKLKIYPVKIEGDRLLVQV